MLIFLTGGHTQILRYLIDNGAALNTASDPDPQSLPIHWAATNGHIGKHWDTLCTFSFFYNFGPKGEKTLQDIQCKVGVRKRQWLGG